jgi:hypothetical protein
MELIVIKIESKEWDYMWDWLSNHPINKDIDNPTIAENQGEEWQYMGSFKNGDNVIHEFRHRCHPATQNKYSVTFAASKDLTADQIENSAKIK